MSMYVYVHCVVYEIPISRTASLISDNISEMLKIPQLSPLYLYTLDNWIMPYFKRLSFGWMKGVNDLLYRWITGKAKLIWLLMKGSRGVPFRLTCPGTKRPLDNISLNDLTLRADRAVIMHTRPLLFLYV
jgi:hypothetical protein